MEGETSFSTTALRRHKYDSLVGHCVDQTSTYETDIFNTSMKCLLERILAQCPLKLSDGLYKYCKGTLGRMNVNIYCVLLGNLLVFLFCFWGLIECKLTVVKDL